MRIFTACYLFIVSAVIISCSTGEQVKDNNQKEYPITDNQVITDNNAAVNVQPKEFNFKFVGYDINIDNPELDRRSYYKIIIDKVEAGRTTIGLESQKKIFEAKISNDRHLLAVEKWALDEKKGQYVKLNNIEQPKPAFTYFEVQEKKAAQITLVNDPQENKSEFQVELED
jgi:hypothetical protein